jgi:TolB-like protein
LKKLSVFALVIVILISVFSSISHAEEKLRIAVLELVNKAGVTDDEAYFLTDKVRRTASQTLPITHFTIMTSENIEEMLPPDMDLKKCTDAKCEVEMGRMIGAEYIVTGEILRYAGDLRVQVKVHHVPTGHFIGSADTDAGSLKEQESMLSNISSQLMGKVLAHVGIEAGPGVTAPKFISTGALAPSQGEAEIREIDPSEAPPVTATGDAVLFITSKPDGAQVLLGGIEAGATSKIFQKTMTPGNRIRVSLKKEFYHTVSFDVDLKPGVIRYDDIELKPAFGSLRIESEPADADVYIGGRKVGTTPYNNTRYPSGSYLVAVEKKWYLPIRDKVISVSDGQNTSESFTLSQDFGTLKIEKSNPPGIKVYLDGKELGTTPGNWRLPPVKKVKLELRKDHFRSKEMEITIDRDQVVEITSQQATLTERIGALQIYTSPPDKNALVYVDGKQYGKAPLTIPKLRDGTHEVRVETNTLAGKETVLVVEGKTASLQVHLTRRDVKVFKFNSSNQKKIRIITSKNETKSLDENKLQEMVSKFEFRDDMTIEISARSYDSKYPGPYLPFSIIIGFGTLTLGWLIIPDLYWRYDVVYDTAISFDNGKSERNTLKTSKWIAHWFYYSSGNKDEFGRRKVLSKHIKSVLEKHKE